MTNATSTSSTMTSGLVRRLRTDIVEGTFLPGAKLVIKDLCERYSVSMIPMREALSRLTNSGFVIAEDQRGFRVASASPSDLADVARARILVECEALKLALVHGDVAWEAGLLAAHHRLSHVSMQDTSSAAHLSIQWDGAHMGFHDALLSACNSPVLLELASNLRQRSARYRHISVNVDASLHAGGKDGNARDVAAEHKAIVDAALARNVEQSTQLLRGHFQRTADLAMQRMRGEGPETIEQTVRVLSAA